MSEPIITIDQFNQAVNTIELYKKQQAIIMESTLDNLNKANNVSTEIPMLLPLKKILATGSVIKFTKIHPTSSLRLDTEYTVTFSKDIWKDGIDYLHVIDNEKKGGITTISLSSDNYKYVVIVEKVQSLLDPNPITAYPSKVNEFLDIHISSLSHHNFLSTRTLNMLDRNNIKTWREFFMKNFKDLKGAGNITKDELCDYFDTERFDYRARRILYGDIDSI